MALLPAESANFGNRQAGYSQRVHTLLYLVKLRWSDYGINSFHLSRSLLASCAEIAVPRNLAAANITANRRGSNSILFAGLKKFLMAAYWKVRRRALSLELFGEWFEGKC
jgi:hypothetical protein